MRGWASGLMGWASSLRGWTSSMRRWAPSVKGWVSSMSGWASSLRTYLCIRMHYMYQHRGHFLTGNFRWIEVDIVTAGAATLRLVFVSFIYEYTLVEFFVYTIHRKEHLMTCGTVLNAGILLMYNSSVGAPHDMWHCTKCRHPSNVQFIGRSTS